MALNRPQPLLVMRPDAVPPAWQLDADRPLLLNVGGDYSYLTHGYYRSLDAEQDGMQVAPTTAECLDAYVVPIAMAKAQAAGMAVPRSQVVTDRFLPPPIMAYPVNPFSSRGELLPDAATLENRRKGLTYTGKYAVLCQALPEVYRIDLLRVVVGRCAQPGYEDFAQAAWTLFRLPLMKVRVIVGEEGQMLSGIEPLPFRTLTPEERGFLLEAGTWLA